MAVEEGTIASARMHGAAFKFGWDRGGGIWEISVHGKLDIDGAIDSSDGGVVCAHQISNRLNGGFSPKVSKRDGIVNAIKPPEPIANYRGVSGRGNSLCSLNQIANWGRDCS